MNSEFINKKDRSSAFGAQIFQENDTSRFRYKSDLYLIHVVRYLLKTNTNIHDPGWDSNSEYDNGEAYASNVSAT